MLTAHELLAHAEALTDSVQLVDRILRAGLFLKASDVHLDPAADSVRVRFRIDGELEDVLHIPANMQSAVVSRLKVLAGLDIAERRAPQDGGFSWRLTGAPGFGTAPLDVRMATLPVRHGERITLRLLETGGERLTLDKIGMSDADRERFCRVLSRPHGLVLLTGPTGSGKTTTLYAAINEILKGEPKSILTVEDPIEYEIPGVVQAEVDSADKVNFTKALKSLLRHDPDVIMIGEIRDEQSLDVAVKAALTGHLVLSSLHTNDAVGAVTRLRNMGLASHLIAATLRLVIAQRLVRRLCVKCGGKGCPECASRGFVGRMGVFELFEPTERVSALISDGANEAVLQAAACADGFLSLADDARAKVEAGATTTAEVLKAGVDL